MMRIKMITTAAGPNGAMDAGKSYEVIESIGKAMVAGGYAVDISPVKVASPPVLETSTVDIPEKAVMPRFSKKKR